MAEITNKHHEPDDNSAHVSHERSDVDIFQIAIYGIGLVFACIISVVVVWGMFVFLAKREDKASPASPMARYRQQMPAEPRLSGVGESRAVQPVGPHVEMKELSESEDAVLNGYGWVDSSKTAARIPIAAAIDLLAQKGVPSKPGPAGANGGFRHIPSDASSGRTLEKISQ
jgi:hypothetical protein